MDRPLSIHELSINDAPAGPQSGPAAPLALSAARRTFTPSDASCRCHTDAHSSQWRSNVVVASGQLHAYGVVNRSDRPQPVQ
jgi:hypothetical protein